MKNGLLVMDVLINNLLLVTIFTVFLQVSTLYYDANSQYYFNPKNLKFCYWDSEHHAFLPAPEEAGGAGGKEPAPATKQDKKSAKKIQKDMEKWARKQEMRKEKEAERKGTGGQELGVGTLTSGHQYRFDPGGTGGPRSLLRGAVTAEVRERRSRENHWSVNIRRMAFTISQDLIKKNRL